MSLVYVFLLCYQQTCHVIVSLKTHLLLALTQCLPLASNQSRSIDYRNALQVAAGVSGLGEGDVSGRRRLDMPIVMEFGSVSRRLFPAAGEFLAQLGTSIIGNPDLLWSVRLEPLVKLRFLGRIPFVGEVIVMLV